MATTLIRPPADITEEAPDKQVMIVCQGLPGRWCSGIRDNISGWATEVGLVRDLELWRLSDATSWPDYVKRYLMDTAEGIDAVIVGVRELRRRLGWGAKISETQARQLGERVMAAASVTTGEVLPRGGDKRSAAAASIGNLPVDHQEDRAVAAGISPRTQRKLDRLARERPDLLDEVRSGRLSAHGAAIAAGIVKPPDAYTTACRAWAKMIPEERDAFEDFIANWRRSHGEVA